MDKIESNSKHRLQLKKNVLTFVGNSYTKGREATRATGDIAHIRHGRYDILLYHNPAVEGFHLPQDAIGVCLKKKKEIIFGLADGVSIVAGTMDNDSGILAHEVVTYIHRLTDSNWKSELTALCQKYLNANILAASTVIWGEVYVERGSSNLKILLVGSPHDMGLLKLFKDNVILNLLNQSSGFIPYMYSSRLQKIILPSKSALLFTTDGIWLEDTAVKELLDLQRTNSDLDDILSFIQKNSSPNKDDQSLLLISVV